MAITDWPLDDRPRDNTLRKYPIAKPNSLVGRSLVSGRSLLRRRLTCEASYVGAKSILIFRMCSYGYN